MCPRDTQITNDIVNERVKKHSKSSQFNMINAGKTNYNLNR